MGGKLSIKKGCGAGDSKKNKATAEAADNPDIKQTDPPSPHAQPGAAAHSEGSSPPGTIPADPVAQDSQTEQPIADVTVSPPSEGQDLSRGGGGGSEERGKSNSENVPKAPAEEKDSEVSREEPQSSAAPAATGAEVQETGAEILVPPVTTEVARTSRSAAGEIPATPGRETTVAEISVDQKPVLTSPTTTHPAESHLACVESAGLLEKDSTVKRPETEVKDCEGESPDSGQSDAVAESQLLGERETATPETAGQGTAWSFTRGSEPEARGVSAEIPTLDMAEETPIDLVLKNEMASCLGLPEKNAVQTPKSPDEAPEKVESEPPVHSEAPVTDSQAETAHSAQIPEPDVKTQQSPERPKDQVDVQGTQGGVRISEQDQQPPEGFVESKEDCSQIHKGAADAIEEDKPSSEPAMAEHTQAVSSPKAEEVTDMTTHEHTVTKTALPDSTAEISLLKTSSELIPDIKLTVYTEVFEEEEEEEEKVESHYEDPSHQVSAPEDIPAEAVSAVSDVKTDSSPLDEPIVEPESIRSETVVPEAKSDVQETKESLDQAATTSELTDLSCTISPEPTSPERVVNPTEEDKETNSVTTDNGLTLDSEGKGDRGSAGDMGNVQEASVVNGTSVDSDGKSDPGKAEENGQEVSCDKLGMLPMVECEITEEVDKLVGGQDSGLVKLDN